jgi:histidinol-phosphate aminotransferase
MKLTEDRGEVIRPAPAIEAIPATTPFVGPEQLMRETGQHELVRLGANESAFGPSPRAVAAMSAELERLSWYGDPESYDLRVALAAKHRVRVEEIIVGAGIDDVMGVAVRAFMPPGATCVTTRGSYPTFNYHVVGYGGTVATADYRPDGRVDLDALLEVARRVRPRVLYLANPDNPSGTFIDREELASFFAAMPHDTLFMLDEAYADYVSPEHLIDVELEDRVLRLRTFSKAYGMAGARIGYGITTESNVQTFQKIRLHYGINRNAQVGALASLGDEAFRLHVVEETAKAREDYYRIARDLGLGYIESHTNFVCIDLGTAERATRVMNELLLRGVWIRKPGAPPIDRYIRVSTGTEPERRAFEKALRAVLDEVRA